MTCDDCVFCYQKYGEVFGWSNYCDYFDEYTDIKCRVNCDCFISTRDSSIADHETLRSMYDELKIKHDGVFELAQKLLNELTDIRESGDCGNYDETELEIRAKQILSEV